MLHQRQKELITGPPGKGVLGGLWSFELKLVNSQMRRIGGSTAVSPDKSGDANAARCGSGPTTCGAPRIIFMSFAVNSLPKNR